MSHGPRTFLTFFIPGLIFKELFISRFIHMNSPIYNIYSNIFLPYQCDSSCCFPCGSVPGGVLGPKIAGGCAAGHWKLDPKRSREKWYFRAKKIEFCEDLYSKDRFRVGGWEKTPQKDRARSCQSEKRGSKPRHICITHHIGSTPPRGSVWNKWIIGPGYSPVTVCSLRFLARFLWSKEMLHHFNHY